MKKFFIAGLLASAPGFAGSNHQQDRCFPKNDLHLQDNLDSLDANIDEAAFNRIITQVGDIYAPIVASHGANLVFERKWTDSTVNAFANQEGDKWTVAMFGGLARRPETTPDGFALVVCHEVGHHLGGFPFYDEDWAGSEGQADYFATQACANLLWAQDKEVNATFRQTAPDVVKQRCDAVYADTDRQNLCYRSSMGGKSLANLLSRLGGAKEPKFETPDPKVVTTTVTSHPEGQCRLDTYFGGALCPVSFTDDAIPGRRHEGGQGSTAAEAVASRVSCTDASFFMEGKRPRCWFAPKLVLSVKTDGVTKTEISGDGDGVWEPGETFGINVPLVNNLLDPIEGATLSVDQGEALADAVYPSIPVGETAYASQAVVVGTPRDQQCGDKFALNAKVAVGQWSQNTRLNFMLGELVLDHHLASAPGAAIPDNSPAGLIDSVQGTKEGQVENLKLSVDIQHAYIGDLRVTLISPLGKEYVVYNRTGGDGDNIKTTFDVTVAREPIAGTWKLKVVDAVRRDTGKLMAWSLDFMTVRCSSGLSFIGADEAL